MRGVYSQGFIFPLSWLNEERGTDISLLKEGDDVTEVIGIKKWVSNDELSQYADTKKIPFPSFVPKTDEPRIQNNPELLTTLIGNEIVISRKEDGCSATYVYNAEKKEFMVCSRNYVVQPDKSVIQYFNVSKSFDIEKKMEQYGKSLAIQGEIVGPSINGNKLKLAKLDFRVFSIYDIEKQVYVSTTEMLSICKDLGFNTVPILYMDPNDARTETVQSLLSYVETIEYNKDSPAEGIVVRTNTCSPRTSFKVISNKYLLKHKL
jgi:RNA ligase (TIGR02306 family)